MVLLLSLGWAHKPTFATDCGSADSACIVGDPEVSIVVYQPVTCDVDQLWLTYYAPAGFELYAQLGVPVIDRLEDYRPSMAVIHPGLPQADQPLPFDVPDGMGVLVFEGGEPESFYEPFTQTESWVVAEETIELPEEGLGYVVAWDPEGWTGKLWLATGTVEDFSDVDLSEFGEWSEQVNDFHETGEYSEPPDITEQACEQDEEESAGCGPGLPAHAALALAALALSRRRRS